jgi:hypothetical protein
MYIRHLFRYGQLNLENSNLQIASVQPAFCTHICIC